MTKLFRPIALSLMILPALAAAQVSVVPSDRVSSGVSIRASATTNSNRIGFLRPGESAEFMGEVPRWYRINHPDHGVGFVSKSWANVVTDGDDQSTTSFDVYIIDVATGLGIYVVGADFNLIYDAGSNDDLSGNRFFSFLQDELSVPATIDHVLISHAHRDHISMLPGIFESVQVANVWDSGVVYASCTYQTVLERIAAEGGNYHTAIHNSGQHNVDFLRDCASTGDSVNMTFSTRLETGAVQLGNNASMTFLHVDGTPRSDLNENSLVVMLNLDGVRILLTGDAGGGEREDPTEPPGNGSVERALIDCCADQLSADVLVLGHHGSMTSSREEFVDSVEARDFIVSSGPMRYRTVVLPDQEVIDLVASKPNARVWRTDTDDDACLTDSNKVGNDSDDRAGGCTNIHISIPGSSTPYDIEIM